MLKFFMVYVLLCCSLINGEDHFDEIVSLGIHCQPAYQIELNNFKNKAYPFDYTISYFDSLINFILNEGKGFLSDKNKIILINNGNEKYIKELEYGIIFLHHFKCDENFLDDYIEIKNTFDRRVNRFFELLKSDKRILFVRQDITYEEAVLLDTLLQSKYPRLCYVILALNMDKEKHYDWGLERIKNFYLRQPLPYVWTGDDQAWKEILDQFCILK